MNTRALLSLLLGFVIWGFFPLYFNYLREVPAEQVLYARILLSGVFLLLFFAFKAQLRESFSYILNKRVLIIATVSALLISANWYIYIWAVQHKLTLQASLGYFITPFFNVLIGIFFFQERLDRWQLGGIVFASLGVLYQLFSLDQLPWISIVLGLSFACYGGVRKKFPLRPMYGLLAEMLVLAPITLVALGRLYDNGQIFEFGGQTLLLLALFASGVITVLPLLLFLRAVVALPMSTVGLAQFITPTLQFMVAIFILNEPFNRHKLITFILIWMGVGLYSVYLYQTSQRVK